MACQQFCLLVLTFTVVHTSEYHSVVEKVVYKYPDQVRAEWELPDCGPYSVCSVMRLMFWQAPVIQRLCRCVEDSECPWKWARPSDQFTMHLDNRSQLKFCQKVTELPTCPAMKSALAVSQRRNKGSSTLATQALCHCRAPAFWQLHRQYYKDHFNGSVVSDQYYRCAKLKKCNHYDFCGHVVQETFSTYYRCSCPVGSLCLNKDRTTHNATELFYRGPVYRAYCLPLHPHTAS